MSLTADQIERYSRQLALPDVGVRGQERLLAARVAVAVGKEPAGEHVALLYLAAAGIGHIALASPTTPVTPDEIARGLLLEQDDAGQDRIAALRVRLADYAPDLQVSAATPGEPTLELPACASLADALWHGGAAALAILTGRASE